MTTTCGELHPCNYYILGHHRHNVGRSAIISTGDSARGRVSPGHHTVLVRSWGAGLSPARPPWLLGVSSVRARP